MKFKISFIPCIIALCATVLILRTTGLFNFFKDYNSQPSFSLIGGARASSHEAPAPASQEPKAADNLTEEGFSPEVADETEKPAEKKSDPSHDQGKGHEAAASLRPHFKGHAIRSTEELGGNINSGEIKTLKSLALRREELNKREEDIKKREELLKSLEQRIEEKVTALKKVHGDHLQLKEEVKGLIHKVDEQEEKKMVELASIYASMAPKKAAIIWNRLDPRVIHELLTRLKVQNANQILSAMDPDKASLITAQRAELAQKPKNLP
jgi:flagellar motility protein MotE (MotC chaperone)